MFTSQYTNYIIDKGKWESKTTVDTLKYMYGYFGMCRSYIYVGCKVDKLPQNNAITNNQYRYYHSVVKVRVLFMYDMIIKKKP